MVTLFLNYLKYIFGIYVLQFLGIYWLLHTLTPTYLKLADNNGGKKFDILGNTPTRFLVLSSL